MKKLKIILLLPLLLSALGAIGKEFPAINYVLSGDELMQFSSGTLEYTADFPGLNAGDLQTLNTVDRKTSFKNVIALVMKDHSSYPNNVKITLDANLDYHMIDRPDPIKTAITLQLDYLHSALTKSNIENLYAFNNAWKVKLTLTKLEVKIDGYALTEAQKSELAKFIEVNVSYTEDRKTRLDYSQIPTGLDACPDYTTDELVIYWNEMPDAEGYELEYTFVDDYTKKPNHWSDPEFIHFDFKENSTRITTKETYYRLPLVVEHGYILFRMRAMGPGGANLNVLVRGQWTAAENGVVLGFPHQYWHFLPHMNDAMNWQSSTTFAEDGKRSDVVTYFDGSFRDRQEVTAMNLKPQLPNDPSLTGITISWGTNPNPTPKCTPPTTDKVREVIAGETIYDFQGREAVSIMPAPTDERRLQFIENLNIADTDQKPYNWKHFDAKSTPCEVKTDALYPKPFGYSHALGAAAYYSANNPNKLGFNAFIPDAEKFPFTQVSYLQDNTGRVAAQSGVGKTFQFGGNHETRFYYAAPNQAELDRLFGTEMGACERYQKNAVMDPNHQVSVTYLNPEGKTIATALAGATPQNLDALPDQTSNHIEVSLVGKNQIDQTGHGRFLEHQFVVTSDDTEYAFDYTLDPELLNYVTCNGRNICLDCIYDFDISLYHNESCTHIPIFTYSGTIGELHDATGAVDLACNNGSTPNFSKHEVHKLNIGTYTLSKTLRVNEAAALAYVAEVFKDTCKDQWNDFMQDEMSKVDTMDCYQNCLQCETPPLPTLDCDTAYCKPLPNRCDVIKAMMIADMSRGGQYAQCDFLPTGAIDASIYPLSIFNPNNLLPLRPQLNEILAKLDLDPKTSATGLAMGWQPEYGEKLLEFHPEHCLRGWCDEPGIEQTLDFDMKILSLEHFGDALEELVVPPCSQGNTGPKPYELLLLADPFFKDGQHATERDKLYDKLQNFGCPGGTIPADELAMQVAYCAKKADLTIPGESTPAINLDGPKCQMPEGYLLNHVFGCDPAYADLEWEMLRAIYLSAKNEVLQRHMNAWVAGLQPPCNTRCIGAENYNFSGLISPRPFAPCEQPNPFCWILYHDKQSRVGTGLDQIIKAWADEGIEFDASKITDFDDPCQFADAILEQKDQINAQVSKLGCQPDSVACASPSAQLLATQDFLNALFTFKLAYGRYPAPDQLLRMLPEQMRFRNGKPIVHVKINAVISSIKITLYSNCTQQATTAPNLPAVDHILQYAQDLVYSARPKRRRRNNIPNSIEWPSDPTPTPKGCDSCTIHLYGDAIAVDFGSFVQAKGIEPFRPRLSTSYPDFKFTAVSRNPNHSTRKTQAYGNMDCWFSDLCSDTIPRQSMLCDSLPPDTVPQPNFDDECVESLLRIARSNAQLRYHQWEDSLKADLLEKYYSKCMQSKETFDLKYEDLQYHYTLYYYDQAGNLVKTVPPAGVRLLDNTQVADVQASRAAGYNTPVLPTHFKETHYHYNTLNELVWQKTPDAGESNFYYDGLGRIVASQNAQQQHDGNVYSYSLYDKQGRMVETGEVTTPSPIPAEKFREFDDWYSFMDGQHNRSEITRTQYDKPWNPVIKDLFRNRKWENLRKRVASVLKFDDWNKLNSKSYAHATHYSYDIEGNVKELIQDFKNGVIGAKSIAYDYDRESGKVNEVIYQGGMPDQFIHRYSYDAANRLTRVQTSRDSILWETDATYLYYRHGLLARMELGTDKVQGLDYIYTLQGWIKGVNGTTTTAEYDMGHDGVAMEQTGPPIGIGVQSPLLNTPPPGYRDIHHPVAKDAFGYVLSYFDEDFSPIELGATGFAGGNTVSFPANPCLTYMPQPNPQAEALYNGNICQMYTQIQGLGNNGFDYSYDQLNRITDSEAWNIGPNGTVTPLAGDAYRGTWTYDADGNILNQFRNGSSEQVEMDKMHYWYYDANNHAYDPEAPDAPDDVTNRLAYVSDPVPAGNYKVDIDGQDPNNYSYDLIGNLIKDTKENIDKITWNLQNKVAAIDKSAGADLEFKYGPMGERIEKTVTNSDFSAENASTYYVRDAQGNIMATYSYRVPLKGTSAAKVLFLDEVDIYGSSRLGVDSVGLVMELPFTIHPLPDPILPGSLPEPKWKYLLRERGDVRYELCNHLGNVLAVISDRKLPVAEPQGTYVADVLTAQDYYAFGMVMPGRSKVVGGYRFGFNGMEGDSEVEGKGYIYATFHRILDPRIGRWFSIDPIVNPGQTPYSSMDNSPIFFSDPYGDDVTYDKWSDKVRVFFKSLVSKSFRKLHTRRMEDHEHLFTYKKTKGYQPLGGQERPSDENGCDIEVRYHPSWFGGIRWPFGDVSIGIRILEIPIDIDNREEKLKRRKRYDYFSVFGSDLHFRNHIQRRIKLRRLVPGREVWFSAGNVPNEAAIEDSDGNKLKENELYGTPYQLEGKDGFRCNVYNKTRSAFLVVNSSSTYDSVNPAGGGSRVNFDLYRFSYWRYVGLKVHFNIKIPYPVINTRARF